MVYIFSDVLICMFDPSSLVYIQVNRAVFFIIYISFTTYKIVWFFFFIDRSWSGASFCFWIGLMFFRIQCYHPFGKDARKKNYERYVNKS